MCAKYFNEKPFQIPKLQISLPWQEIVIIIIIYFNLGIKLSFLIFSPRKRSEIASFIIHRHTLRGHVILGTFVYFFVRYENFALYRNKKRLLRADPWCRSVIKEFVNAFSCAYIELWMHSGSLESTQEARVALGYRLVQILRIFRTPQTSRVHP